ncbi:MAG: hypothetical protein RLZZ312_865 [Bacteroidota bacterium]|jgi:hypothetical protein
MKNIFVLTLLTLSIIFYGQKKKPVKIPQVEIAKSIAKNGNLTADLIASNFVLTIDNKTTSKDTIVLCKATNGKMPLDVKIQPFSTKGTSLYLITWTDKSKTESKLLKEDITINNAVIVNLLTKSKIHVNKQLSSEITMIQYLDVKKTVSETIQKKHSEGYSFLLLNDGDFIKKTKSKEIRYSYNKASNLYEENLKKK